MRPLFPRLAATFFLLYVFNLLAPDANAAPPADAVRTALVDMHAWVGEGDKGNAWRRYLKSDQLLGQLDKGDAAEKEVVADVLQRYTSDVPGIQSKRFVAVRAALQSWLEELSLPGAGELAEAARAAKSEFKPLSSEHVAQTKAAAAKAIAALDLFLSSGDERKQQAWKKYLQWQSMHDQLNSSGEPDLRELQLLAGLYHANHSGLELAQFVAVRDSLREYVNAAYFASDAKLPEAYATNLEDLATRLEAFAQNPTSDNALLIGRTIGWLESAGQADTLVRAVRRQYWRPNLFARVSERLIAAGIEDEIDDTSPVSDVILGTTMYGTARTQGQTSVHLIPSAGKAAIEIRLTGTAWSNNVGYQGPVTIYTNGATQIDARKRVNVDDQGLHPLPAVASCATSSSINGIGAPLRIIERIAWNKAGQSKGQAERIASSHAEVRVARRVDQQAGEMLGEANKSFLEKFRNPLLRRNSFPQLLRFGTTGEHLYMRLMQAGPFHLAAPTDPPEIQGDHDLAVRVHESLVGNFSQAVIGGETLTDERLAELMEEYTGSVPEELQIGPDKDPWSITFASEHPISAGFTGQTCTVTIRGRRFTRGDQGINNSMEISATYTIEKTPAGAKLTRQGEVAAEYTTPGRQSVQQIAFKTFLRKKFDALFKQEVATEGLKLPGRWERAGKLRLDHLDADKGWLALGWLQPSDTVRTAKSK